MLANQTLLFFWKVCLLVVPVGFDLRIYNIRTLHFNNSVDKRTVINMFIFQKQQNFMEIPSGVHGNFKITKPSRFSNVQFFFEIMVNNGSNQFSNIPNGIPDKKKMLFAISYLNRIFFNWVPPRLDFFFGK